MQDRWLAKKQHVVQQSIVLAVILLVVKQLAGTHIEVIVTSGKQRATPSHEGPSETWLASVCRLCSNVKSTQMLTMPGPSQYRSTPFLTVAHRLSHCLVTLALFHTQPALAR